LRQAYNVANASADAASHAWASYLLDKYLQHGKTGVEVGEGFYK
jgi:3-hydroxyacyl-CoA dehydrogenase